MGGGILLNLRSLFLRPFVLGCALNGNPDGGGGMVSSASAGGMYTGCGGMGTGLPHPNFISKPQISLPVIIQRYTSDVLTCIEMEGKQS